MDDNDLKNVDQENKVVPIDIEDEMRRAFIEYSMSVIVDRALPDVRDGLKPVHRRIIYSMYELGYTPDQSYRKCATTTGYVMGKYHPHGDAAIYDSLVRLAQDFSMRYMLVDGNGNFGSRDGDPPAAQRYTEAKLSKIAMELVADINKNTVDFRPNYDEHEVEPAVLPSRFPNLLVNGSYGIAVGMATNIPPHNLREVIDGTVALIDNPDMSIDDLMVYIKGPDFPTAANILGRQGIREAYRTGKGRIIMRAEAIIEDMPNNRQRIVVTELPYQVNNANLVARIADLVKDKTIDTISGLRDEYSKAGIRIVIELKKDANPNVVLNQLYKNTPLQETFSVNMLALVTGEGGKYQPQVINLKEALEYYILHQKEVVTRRTQFDLDKDLDRAHILEGTLKAIDNIDEVIKIIRESRTEPDAKEALIARFDFTERQAQYIVDLRLGRLTGMEREKILSEYEEKMKSIEYYRSLLADERLLMNVVKNELIAIRDAYGDERKTRIQPYDGEIDIDDLIHEQDIAITLTQCGYIKRTASDVFKAQRRGGKGIIGLSTREEDFVKFLLITSSHNILLFITNKGKVYSLKGYEIPDSGRTSKGMAIVNLLQLDQGEKVATVIPVANFDDSKYLIFGTKNGVIKKTELSEYSRIRKGGLIAIDLREEDELVNALLVDNEDIVIATRKGMAIRFSEEDIRSTGRSSIGVKGITLREGDHVIGIDACIEGTDMLIVTEKGLGKRTKLSEFRVQSRGGKGLKSYRITERTGEVVSMMTVNDDNDVMLITSAGIIIRIHAADINVIGRAASGVILMRTTEDNRIVSCARLSKDEGEEEVSALPEQDAVIEEPEEENSDDVSEDEDPSGDEDNNN